MKNTPKVSYKEIGYRVQTLILERGDTIPEVAIMMGLSVGHFYKLLNGQYTFADKYLNWIADHYNVSPVYLLYGKDYIEVSQVLPFEEQFNEDLLHIKELPADSQNPHIIKCMETVCEILKSRHN